MFVHNDPSRKVLLLNASEEVLGLICWQKAVVLFMNDRATKPYDYDYYYHIRTTQGTPFLLPTALILNRYVRIPERKVILTRRNVFKRDNYKCQYCGTKVCAETATLDHVVPTSKGGSHDWRNLVTACKKCNTKKADYLLDSLEDMRLNSHPTVPSKHALLNAVMHDETSKTEWSRWTKHLTA